MTTNVMQILATLCCLWAVVGTTGLDDPNDEHIHLENPGRCEPITINLCLKNLPYNSTMMPNLLKQHNQEDAGLDIHQYAPLVKIECSPDLRFFLCLMYVPVCTILGKPLPPCRSICERARAGCERMLLNFGYLWPANLNCSTLPEYGKDPEILCIDSDSKSEMLEMIKTQASSGSSATSSPSTQSQSETSTELATDSSTTSTMTKLEIIKTEASSGSSVTSSPSTQSQAETSTELPTASSTASTTTSSTSTVSASSSY